MASATVFPASTVPQASEDPLFGLVTAYRADTFEKKVDLGIGVYRDDNAKPWVLPVVKRVMFSAFRSGFVVERLLEHANSRRVGG